MAIRSGATMDQVMTGPGRYDGSSCEYLYEVACIHFVSKRNDTALDCHIGICASVSSAGLAAEAPGKVSCNFHAGWISWNEMKEAVMEAGVPAELIGDLVDMPKGHWDGKRHEYMYRADEIEVRAYRGFRQRKRGSA